MEGIVMDGQMKTENDSQDYTSYMNESPSFTVVKVEQGDLKTEEVILDDHYVVLSPTDSESLTAEVAWIKSEHVTDEDQTMESNLIKQPYEKVVFTDGELLQIVQDNDMEVVPDSGLDCGSENIENDGSAAVESAAIKPLGQVVALPTSDVQVAEQWTETHNVPLTANPGLIDPSRDLQTPREYFDLLFTNRLITKVVDETNSFAQTLKDACTQPKARIKSWVDLSVQEFMVFLGLLYHMGTIKLARISDYWNCDPQLFNLTCFRRCMSRDRFSSILSCLHFAPNPGPDDSTPTDRLFKIRPVIDIFNETMENLYVAGHKLCTDETVVLWRGKLSFRQFNKIISHPHEIKMYMLNEPTGLVHRFMAYTGAADAEVGGRGHSEKVVLDGKLYYGYSVFVDDYCNTVGLVHELLRKLTDETGTLRSNRVGIPRDITSDRLGTGEVVQRSGEDGVCILKWKDKREAFLISPIYSGESVRLISRRGREVMKPEANVHEEFSGIDKAHLAYYPFERKSLEWYKKLGVHIFHMCLVNAYFLYVKKFPHTSLHDFRLSVIKSLLPPLSSSPPPIHRTRNELIHYLKRFETREGTTKTKCKKCRLCSTRGTRRKETQYFCPGCPKLPALCVYPCFRDFHMP